MRVGIDNQLKFSFLDNSLRRRKGTAENDSSQFSDPKKTKLLREGIQWSPYRKLVKTVNRWLISEVTLQRAQQNHLTSTCFVTLQHDWMDVHGISFSTWIMKKLTDSSTCISTLLQKGCTHLHALFWILNRISSFALILALFCLLVFSMLNRVKKLVRSSSLNTIKSWFEVSGEHIY